MGTLSERVLSRLYKKDRDNRAKNDPTVMKDSVQNESVGPKTEYSEMLRQIPSVFEGNKTNPMVSFMLP